MDPPSPPLFAPGQRIGRYELLQRLAVGGMAEIYAARAVGPDDFRKRVVVKRLLPQHALDPQLLRMFLDEARLLARLAHPNIPQVFDVGDQPELQAPYFVMELIDGARPARHLDRDRRRRARAPRRGPPSAYRWPRRWESSAARRRGCTTPTKRAARTAGRWASCTGTCRRRTCSSAMDGAVKLTDFGIAKWANQRSRTEHGQLKGKFAYMSPEQCRGEPLDRRSDVFALGSLLYELTTGRPAFTAQSDFELLSTIVSRPPRPPTWPGETAYPPALAAIVMRALEQKPADRFPTAQALQLALEDFARQAGLTLSAVTLSAWLRRLFADRPHSFWPESRDQEAPASATKAPRARTLTDVAPTARTDGESSSRAQATPAAGAPPRPRTITASRRLAQARRKRAALIAVGAAALALALAVATAAPRWRRGDGTAGAGTTPAEARGRGRAPTAPTTAEPGIPAERPGAATERDERHPAHQPGSIAPATREAREPGALGPHETSDAVRRRAITSDHDSPRHDDMGPAGSPAASSNAGGGGRADKTPAGSPRAVGASGEDRVSAVNGGAVAKAPPGASARPATPPTTPPTSPAATPPTSPAATPLGSTNAAPPTSPKGPAAPASPSSPRVWDPDSPIPP